MSRTWRNRLFQDDSFWRAFAIGIVCGSILTASGEWLRIGSETHVVWRILGSLLTLPGIIYTALTGRDPFLSLSAMCVYFLVQIAYYTVVVFFSLAIVRLIRAQKNADA